MINREVTERCIRSFEEALSHAHEQLETLDALPPSEDPEANARAMRMLKMARIQILAIESQLLDLRAELASAP